MSDDVKLGLPYKENEAEREARIATKREELSKALQELQDLRASLVESEKKVDVDSTISKIASSIGSAEKSSELDVEIKKVEKQIKSLRKELDNASKEYESSFERMKKIIEEQNAELEATDLLSEEELKRFREEFNEHKLVELTTSQEIQARVTALKKKLTALSKQKNDMVKAAAIGLTYDEYVEINSLLRKKNIVNAIYSKLGIDDIVFKSASERSKEEQETMKKARTEIIEEIAKYKVEHTEVSILDSIQVLYSLDIQMSKKGTPRVVSLSKYELATISENADLLPAKVPFFESHDVSSYKPDARPEDMIGATVSEETNKTLSKVAIKQRFDDVMAYQTEQRELLDKLNKIREDNEKLAVSTIEDDEEKISDSDMRIEPSDETTVSETRDADETIIDLEANSVDDDKFIEDKDATDKHAIEADEAEKINTDDMSVEPSDETMIGDARDASETIVDLNANSVDDDKTIEDKSKDNNKERGYIAMSPEEILRARQNIDYDKNGNKFSDYDERITQAFNEFVDKHPDLIQGEDESIIEFSKRFFDQFYDETGLDFRIEKPNEFILNTNIPKPRDRHPYESDEEYTRFLEMYYDEYLPKDKDEVEEFVSEKEGSTIDPDANVESVQIDQPIVGDDNDIETVSLFVNEDKDEFYVRSYTAGRYELHSASNPARIGGALCYRISRDDMERLVRGANDLDNVSPYRIATQTYYRENDDKLVIDRDAEEVDIDTIVDNTNDVDNTNEEIDETLGNEVVSDNNDTLRIEMKDGEDPLRIEMKDGEDPLRIEMNDRENPLRIEMNDREEPLRIEMNDRDDQLDDDIIDEPTDDTTDEPTDDTTDEPTDDTTDEPVEEPVEPIEEPVEPIEEPVEPIEEPIDRTIDNDIDPEVINLTLFRDLDDNNQVYAPVSVLDVFGIVSAGTPTDINGNPSFKITPLVDQKINELAQKSTNPKYNVNYIDVHLKKKENEQKEEKTPEKKKPRPHVETIIQKLTAGLDIKAKDGKRFVASNIHVAKSFKNELKTGNFLYSIVSFATNLISVPINLARKIGSKLLLGARGKKSMAELKNRLDNLSEEELEVLFDEYKGSQLKTDMNNQINPLIIDRLRRFGLDKVTKLNNEIGEQYKVLFVVVGQLDDIDKELAKSGLDEVERRALLDSRANLLSQAASCIRNIEDKRIEANNLLSGGVHGLEEDFKAVSTKLSYVGKRFAKTNNFDNELQARLAKFGQGLRDGMANDDDEAIFKNFMALESEYSKNTTIKKVSLTGSKSVGSKYYTPLAERFDYRDDPFIRNLFTTIALATSIYSAINAYRVHQIEQQAAIDHHNADINSVNNQNDAIMGQVNQTGTDMSSYRSTFSEGMQAQGYGADLNTSGVFERGNLDANNWNFTDSYHAADHQAHIDYNQMHDQTVAGIQSTAADYAAGVIGQADALQRMADVANTAHRNLVNTVSNYKQICSDYAATHPQFDLHAYTESMDYLVQNADKITNMNQAMVDITNIGDTLSSLNAAHASTLASLPSDMYSTLMASFATCCYAGHIVSGMKASLHHKYGNDITDMMDEYVNGHCEEATSGRRK